MYQGKSISNQHVYNLVVAGLFIFILILGLSTMMAGL